MGVAWVREINEMKEIRRERAEKERNREREREREEEEGESMGDMSFVVVIVGREQSDSRTLVCVRERR